MSERECAGCSHWRRMKDQEPSGECHRVAPTPIVQSADEHPSWVWPLTAASDFCGEFLKGGSEATA